MADQGYAKLAHLMSHNNEAAILRRFSRLNFQNLLYLQAEITHLEKELQVLAEKDAIYPGHEAYATHWKSLALKEPNPEDRGQWDKFMQIRAALKEYNTELLQIIQLHSTRGPRNYDLEFFRNYLKHPKMGHLPLDDIDLDSWSVENTHDLVAIDRRPSTDPLTKLILERLLPLFHKSIGRKFKKPDPAYPPESDIAVYVEKPIHNAISVLVTVLASMIPISSIVVLYFVKNDLDRLVIVVAFTGIFALCLALTAKAKRVEVFAATSTFAAVQVVFITSN